MYFFTEFKKDLFSNSCFSENHQKPLYRVMFLRRKRYTGGRFRRPETTTCIAFPVRKHHSVWGNLAVSQKHYVFKKRAFSENHSNPLGIHVLFMSTPWKFMQF